MSLTLAEGQLVEKLEKANALLQRAAELLRIPVSTKDDPWWRIWQEQRDDWLRDAGMNAEVKD